MAMEDVEKDVSSLHISFPREYRGKEYKLLLSTFKNNSTPTKEEINELLKIYPSGIFNFDYLEQYWIFDIQ